MYQRKSAVAFILSSTVVAVSLLACSSNLFAGQTEGIGSLFLQPDGTRVQLDGVAVDKICARQAQPYFVVRDATQPSRRIVVLCRPPLELSKGLAVGIEGTLGTLSNGERCIAKVSVYAYFDSSGRATPWVLWPFLDFAGRLSKQLLPIPDSPVPPSDPSLSADGSGVPGEVTATRDDGASRYATVASLLATSPPLLTPVELSCKPVLDVGSGFIVVGDDTTDAAVRVHTGTKVKPGDRIVRLTGTTHSENGRLVLYSDSGPRPYFDPQGFVGQVQVAGAGTSAYIATLSDAVRQSMPGSYSIMSMVDPAAQDGTWVYLTGQVVTYTGDYYSYDLSPNQWVHVYNIQGPDRTPRYASLVSPGDNQCRRGLRS